MSQNEEKDDDYAALDDFSQFTEEDFAQIDVEISTTLKKGLPKLNIEFETRAAEPAQSSTFRSSHSSPLRQFRRNGILSVTDLVSPAWCEVQFDYGLRQKRSRRLEYRPGSFTSKSGKEIQVDQQVAAVNDQVTKKGKSIHKKLEQEIRSEEVIVEIVTNEERWALRFLNMISSFESLLLLNYSREIPIFGVVHGHVVVGIIDEIRRLSRLQTSKRPLASPPTTPRRPKRLHSTPSPSQAPITSFFPHNHTGDSENSQPNLPIRPKAHHFNLHLLDTKTRRNNSLPNDEDTISSRLQLMLYSRFLSDLLGPFDFSAFWEKLGLDATMPFSDTFLSQMNLLVDPSTPPVRCLEDLEGLWTKTVSTLDVVGVDSNLQLVYRFQSPASKRSVQRENSRLHIPIDVMQKIEEDDIARAIQASLQDLRSEETVDASKSNLLNDRVDSSPDPSVLQSSSSNSDKDSVDDPELALAIQLSLQANSDNSVTTSQAQDAAKTSFDTKSDGAPIIGIKEFNFDGEFLDEYLSNVLQWWTGARKPVGVTLQQSWRCSFCEYRQDCEWREEKAKEFEDGLKNRNA
ncbi:hypothetical protein VKT23_005481 [Stygiomarasmius scandens]|uniref:Exonuclease V n=1 Tax=Marasmiellus scandens TaxID=2682957 RepID=A0ABR1JR30_9AGAR